MIETIRLAFNNLLRKPGRSALTVLAVAIGVSSVILINVIGTYGKEAVNNELTSLGMNGVLISSVNEISPDITNDDVKTVASLSYVKKASPLLVTTAQITSRSENFEAYLWGIGSDAKDVIDLNLMYGRFLNSSDIAASSQVCMVDNSFARNAYGRDNIVGKNVSVSCEGYTSELTVIGVIQTGSGLLSNMMGDYIPNFIYTADKNVQQALNTSGYHRIVVKTNINTNMDSISERLASTLERSSGKYGGYTVTNLVKHKEALNNIMDIVSTILLCVGAVALIVASIGIMTVMLVSVSERTREIGIKKSIGATKGIIIREFLCESALLSLSGCIIGFIIVLISVVIGSVALNINLSISYDVLIFTVLLSAFTGIAFGVYPAYRASQLKPVDALRYE